LFISLSVIILVGENRVIPSHIVEIENQV